MLDEQKAPRRQEMGSNSGAPLGRSLSEIFIRIFISVHIFLHFVKENEEKLEEAWRKLQ